MPYFSRSFIFLTYTGEEDVPRQLKERDGIAHVLRGSYATRKAVGGARLSNNAY